MKTVALTLVLGLILGSCSAGPGESEVVTNITEQALLPGLDRAALAAEELSMATATFCATPSLESHAMAKQAWLKAKSEWEHAELTTFFGPADMLRTLSKVDYEPISESGIEELLASGTTIDDEYVDSRAASTQRGLGAVEYTLHRDIDSASEQTVCELTVAASEVVAIETRSLHNAWAGGLDGGAPYAETFNGTMTSNQALGDVIAAIVETLKRQSLFELGKALGISAPEPVPASIPEGAAGAGAAMYRAQLEAIRETLEAGGSDSLAALITSRTEQVGERIDALLTKVIDDLAVIEGPMRSMAAETPGDLDGIYDSIADLRGLFESDVVSLLDITLGFSDTDGDSG